jgi:AcrR family transcriptional regulator
MALEYSGGGDPERSLALLWRHRAPEPERSRGRRPTLTLDRVVAAAIELADTEGLAAVSMQRIAKRLGAGTMTLYTYVPSKNELVDLMVDAALRERALPGPHDPQPEGWRARIELYAARTRAMFHRHPWFRQVSTIRPALGPGMMDAREYLLAALYGTGLSPHQVGALTLALETLVDAAVAVEVDSRQIEHATGQTNEAWWQARTSFWDTYFEPDRYPTMVRIWHEGGFDRPAAETSADAYRHGLARLLDGIQALLDIM